MGTTKKEIEVQIALGTIESPQQIAQIIKKTSDIEALEWAAKHKNTKVRIAAIKNPALPISSFLHACVFELSQTAREAVEQVMATRCDEIHHTLELINCYPQLKLDFRNTEGGK